MPRDFKYDLIQLIQGIKDRPCLWDKTLEVYKDRIERRTAWEEIFHLLEERYEEMTPEEKRLVEEQILTKWTNVRDTFLKTLKVKMGRPKRKYLLYDHLKFLTKVNPPEMPDEVVEYTVSNDTQYSKPEEEFVEKPRKKSKRDIKGGDEYVPPTKRHSTKREPDVVEDCDSHSHQNEASFDYEETEPRLMNEDEAFFASLLPTVVRYTMEERLDFRMEVLAVMKRINDKRKWNE